MPLIDVEFEPPKIAIPANVAALLADAKNESTRSKTTRGPRCRRSCPAISKSAYRALAEIQADQPGHRPAVHRMGQRHRRRHLPGVSSVSMPSASKSNRSSSRSPNKLLNDHGIAVDFVCGSFVPDGIGAHVDWVDGVAWLTTDGPDGYEDLGTRPDDFDVVFAYPWPGEEQVIFDLFADTPPPAHCC